MDALLGRARDSRTGFVDLVRSKKATLGSSWQLNKMYTVEFLWQTHHISESG